MTMRDVIAQARVSEPHRAAQGDAIVEFHFDASESFFAGHFPDQPILPGVFQLEMARAAAEWTLQRPLWIRAVRKAKFLRPVRPNETVRVNLKLSEDGDAFLVQARFVVGGQAVGETLMQLGASESKP